MSTPRDSDHARSVVITAAAASCPLGLELAEIDRRLGAGEVVVAEPGPAGEPSVARVPHFDDRIAFHEPKAVKLADRGTRLAVAAATRAIAEAGLGDAPRPRSWAVVLGRSASNLQTEELARALGPELGARAAVDPAAFEAAVLSRLSPLWLLVNLPNMVGAHVGIQLGCEGANHTVTSDSLAGLQALIEAWHTLRAGEQELVIAGGADSSLDPLDLAALGQVWPAGAEPVAEGAAVLVLEDESSARARGARPLGRLRHGAVATTGAQPRQEANLIQTALDTATWLPDQVDLVIETAPPGPAADGARAGLALSLGVGSSGHQAARSWYRPSRECGHTLACAGSLGVALACLHLGQGRSRRALVHSASLAGASGVVLLEQVERE